MSEPRPIKTMDGRVVTFERQDSGLLDNLVEFKFAAYPGGHDQSFYLSPLYAREISAVFTKIADEIEGDIETRYFHDQGGQHWFTYDPKEEEADRESHRASCREVTKAEYDKMLEREHEVAASGCEPI